MLLAFCWLLKKESTSADSIPWKLLNNDFNQEMGQQETPKITVSKKLENVLLVAAVTY